MPRHADADATDADINGCYHFHRFLQFFDSAISDDGRRRLDD